MRLSLGFVMASVMSCIASTASAQDAMFSTFASDTANNIANTQIRNSMLGIDQSGGRHSSVARRVGSGTPAYAMARPPSSADTRYREDPRVTQKVETAYLQFIERQDPAELDIVRADLRRFNPAEAWGRQTAADGFRTGDIVDAVASYWLLNWVIANRQDDTAAQARGVRMQVRRILSSDPNIAGLSEAQRQEMAEALMLNFIYQQNSYLVFSKRRDQARLDQASHAAATRFHSQLGVDPRGLILTDHGFARR